MNRPRQSQVHLAPLLDVIFMILLFYVAALVGRGHEEAEAFAEERRELGREEARLHESFAGKTAEVFEARQELASERSERRRVAEALGTLEREFERLAQKAGASEELLEELKKRFGERAAETAALLATLERHFDIYEITFYTNRLVRIATPKKEVFERPVADPNRAVEIVRDVLPANFDPSRSVFLVRYERTQGWIAFDRHFYPEAKRLNWIVNERPVEIDE